MSNTLTPDPTQPVGAIGSPATTQYRASAVLFAVGGGISTVSTTDASITSFSMLANTLGVNQQAVRIRAGGRQITQAGSFNVKFGATVLATVTIAAGAFWHVDLYVVRTSAGAQVATGITVAGATVAAIAVQPGETLTGAVLIDFRGSVTSGGTLAVDAAVVEFVGS